MKLPVRCLFILLCLNLFSEQIALAQYQRKVLVEQFTNSNCIPCVPAGAQLDTLANQNPGTLICIKYHVNYPSPADPFYMANPTENMNRSAYYGIVGVPYFAMDGSYEASTGSPVGASFLQRLQMQSPFEIKTSYTIKDNPGSLSDSMYIITVVKAGVYINNAYLKLRTAATEKDVNMASGLFSHFSHPLQKMIPDTAGISLPAVFFPGDSVIITTTMLSPVIYDFNQLDIVSFVQDDATKEVLQAGEGVNDPDYTISLVSMPKIVKMVNATDDAAFTIPFRITSRHAGNYSVVLHGYSVDPGWSKQMSINALTNPDSLNIFLPANSDSVINVFVTANSGGMLHSMYNMFITISNDQFSESYLNFFPSASNNFYLEAYSKCINMVFHQGWQSAGITTALTQTGQPSVSMDYLNLLDTVNFNMTSVKNLFVNYNNDTIKDALPFMTNLLNSGGNVYFQGDLAGQHIFSSPAFTDAQNFYHNYMGADYVSSMLSQPVEVHAITSDLFYGATFSPAPWMDNFCVMAPFALAPNSSPIFFYGSNTNAVAALRNTDGNFKTAMFGFFPTSISNQNIINQIIQYTINWFNSVNTGIPGYSNESSTDFQIFPNPAIGKTWITLPSSNFNRTIKVFDMLGNKVAEKEIPLGSQNFELNVLQFSTGIYTCSVYENSSLVSCSKLVVGRR